MFKHKHLFHKITLVSSAAILSASLIPLAFVTTASNKTVVAKANAVTNEDIYVPLEIKDECYNSNVFITAPATETEDPGCYKNIAPVDKMLDVIGEGQYARSAWYTTDAHELSEAAKLQGQAFEPDDDGNVTITSKQTEATPNLTWKLRNIGVTGTGGKLKNNAIRVWGDDTHKSQTIEFNNLGIYKGMLYLLVTAANFTTGSTTLKVHINYATGETQERTFTVYDWCKDESAFGEHTIACDSYYRYTRYINATDHVYETTRPKFVQCGIPVDSDKFIKNIEVSWDSSTADGMVLTIYGISGVVSNISAPTNLAYSDKSKTKVTLSWDSVTDASRYSLDISTDSTFTTGFLDGYQGKIIDKSASATVTEAVTNLYPGTTYYARVRSVDAKGYQSAPCQAISFKSDDLESTSIQVFDMKSNISRGEEFTFTSLVNGETIEGKTYPYPDQKVDWTISPNDGLTITEGEATQSGGKYWKLKGTKAGSYTVTGTKGEAPSYSTTITVTPPMPSGLNIDFTKGRDDQLTVTWDAVDNIDHFILTVSDNDSFTGEPVYHEANIDPTTTSMTIDNVSDKKTYYARLLTEADNVKSDPIYANINHTPWWTWWIVAGSIMGGGLFVSMAPIISVANNKRLVSIDAKEKNKK